VQTYVSISDVLHDSVASASSWRSLWLRRQSCDW
jgi:hypothetical protein